MTEKTDHQPQNTPPRAVQPRAADTPDAGRRRGRPRKIEGDHGTNDGPPARSNLTTDSRPQTPSEKAKFDEARRRATIELRPLIEQMLNQPIPSIRAPGRTIDKKTVLAREKVAIGLMRRFSAENSVAIRIDGFPYAKFANWLLSYSVPSVAGHVQKVSRLRRRLSDWPSGGRRNRSDQHHHPLGRRR